MNKTEYGCMLVTAVLAGLVGGVVSGRFSAETALGIQQPVQPETILQAERFEVVDQEGRRRAVLGLVFGKPSLWIADENGEPRVALDLMANDTPTLFLYGTAGKAKASFGFVEGGPSLDLVDKEGRTVWKAH